MKEPSVISPMLQIKKAEARRISLGPCHIKKSMTSRNRTKIVQFLLL